MTKYRVTAQQGLRLSPGAEIGLTDETLIARFGPALKAKRKGRFEVLKPLTLKIGTEFTSSDDMPKSMLAELTDLDAAAETEAAADETRRAADREAAARADRKAAARAEAEAKAAAAQGAAQSGGQDPATLV